MKNSKRPLVIVLAILLVLIAAGAFFFLDRNEGEVSPPPAAENAAPESSPAPEQDKTASDDGSGAADTNAAPSERSAESEGTASSGPAPQKTADTESENGLRIPTFDVLRVEPDGTAVIAGAAEPKGRLEVMEADSVLSASDVTDTGDFVAIIDTPLKPGDHLIYLDVSMPDGRKARSLQTATISIPEAPGGELLALITEPGKASEIVTMPDSGGATPGAAEVAVKQDRKAEGESQPEEPAAETPPSPAMETELPGVEVRTTAELSGESQTENRNAQDIVATVIIKAVEIEGNRLFIAGEGKTGATVRGYIDDSHLADSDVNIEGNFVIEAEVDVSVGLHTIRIDMIGENGSVIARAVVPFDRPPGDQVAAISTAPAGESQTQADGTETFMQPQLEGSDNAVIIRRGDNLWRISRRLYGRGVRYTTIYLANEPQIANPNIILPGQVFSVPVAPLPIGEAEDIHRRLLKGMPVGPEYKLPAGDN